MKTFTAKAVSLLLSLALLMSVFTVAGVLTASAETVNENIDASDLAFELGQNASNFFTSSKESGNLTVTKGTSSGTGKGFTVRIPKLQYYPVTNIVFNVTVNWEDSTNVHSIYCAYGKYAYIQDATNHSTNIIKKGNVSFTSGTAVNLSFDLTDVKENGYNTIFFSKVDNFNSSSSLVINSVSITYDSSERKYFNGSFVSNDEYESANLLAGKTWSVGQWSNASSPTFDTLSTTRIGINELVEVVPGSTLTFSIKNKENGVSIDSTYKFVLRAYDSSKKLVPYKANNVADTYSFGSTENNAVIDLSQSNLTSVAYIGVGIYINGVTVTTSLLDTYEPSLIVKASGYSKTIMTDDTSVLTAPDALDFSSLGYTFIGWKSSDNKLYKAGSTITLTDDTEFTAVAAKVETQSGASVRWSNTDKKRGLRFETQITGNLPAEELVKVFSPAKVGTQITMDGVATPKTVSNSTDAGGANEYATVIDNTTSSTLIYYGSVTEFESSKTNIKTDFTAKGVATVVYADDSTADFESSVSSTRNMFDVATAAYNSLNSGSDKDDAYREGKMKLLQEVYSLVGDGGAED